MVSKKEHYENSKGSFLTATEAALYLNVHINTLRRWENKGLLQGYRIGPRGDRRFSLEDLEECLAKWRGAV